MNRNGKSNVEVAREVCESGRTECANAAENLAFSPTRIGQCYPQHYPHREDFERLTDDPLGEPLSASQVARVIGCSVWNVRHRYLPSGLPYFQIGRAGKLMFYRKQVVQWILEKQKQRGGE